VARLADGSGEVGMPYRTIHLLAALLTAAAVAMILWLGPFPLAIRSVIPFSYFRLYQYSVVARGYALLAPLLFAIPWFLPRARSRPWILAALLILLANVSIRDARSGGNPSSLFDRDLDGS
jgi:hypothetical protein